MNLKKNFSDFLKTEHLLGEKILIMVSGGVDSRVLLEIAWEVCETEKIAVFHLDHNTREHSGSDFELVNNLCLKKGVNFYGKKLEQVAEKNQENFWRVQRKKLSQEAAQDFGAKRILTGHHATDLVETMIFRLTKGAGVKGLSPFDTSTKPFWRVPKTILGQYAKDHDLEFVPDESNKDERFQRNLIRNKVLPELRKITPNLEQVFVRESEIFAEVQTFLEDSCHLELISRAKIPLKELQEMPPILRATLLQKICEAPFSASELQDFEKWVLGDPKGSSEKKLGETSFRLSQNILNWN